MASSSGTGTSDPTSPPSGSGPGNKVTDGWDNEEWGSLEEEPVSIVFFSWPHKIIKTLQTLLWNSIG